MRFFLLLAAVVALSSLARASIPFQMPGPFVDGTIMTIFFYNKDNLPLFGHDATGPRKVVIDFYNQPTNYPWRGGGVYDLPAKITVTTDSIETNTFEYGLWWKEQGDKVEQRPNTEPATHGWWRVDLIKIDSRRMHIFFQGFWSGIREFGTSLDKIQSAYIGSSYIDKRFLEITVKTANADLQPFNGKYEHDAVSKPLAKINTFPIGSRIDLIAMLRATADQNSKLPSLCFGPKPVEDFDTIFLYISQSWDEQKNTHVLTILSNEPGIPACINTKPNGDLQHLQLERISQGVIRMRVMYHPTANNMDRVICDLTIPPSMWSYMDRPFNILSIQGAIIFHIEQSIPQSLLLLPSSHPEIQA